jgi:hypothetical protein
MTGYSLEYVLDSLSLDQIILLYDYGLEFEKTKAIILLNKLGEALSGKKSVVEDRQDSPDIKKFKKIYGNKIKQGKKHGK